jgi:hypothetical protein
MLLVLTFKLSAFGLALFPGLPERHGASFFRDHACRQTRSGRTRIFLAWLAGSRVGRSCQGAIG